MRILGFGVLGSECLCRLSDLLALRFQGSGFSLGCRVERQNRVKE